MPLSGYTREKRRRLFGIMDDLIDDNRCVEVLGARARVRPRKCHVHPVALGIGEQAVAQIPLALAVLEV